MANSMWKKHFFRTKEIQPKLRYEEYLYHEKRQQHDHAHKWLQSQSLVTIFYLFFAIILGWFIVWQQNHKKVRIYVKSGNLKETKVNSEVLLIKHSGIILILLTAFYLIMWPMTHQRNSWKISILKIWQLVFFWGVKTYFGILPLKWCIFRHEKNDLMS